MSSNHDSRHHMGSTHIPERRCIGCGRHAAKHELARFVAVGDVDHAHLVRDDRGTAPGRGMYICPCRACFDVALKRRAFLRAARRRAGTLVVDHTLADAFE